jgi:hypothetical protein
LSLFHPPPPVVPIVLTTYSPDLRDRRDRYCPRGTTSGKSRYFAGYALTKNPSKYYLFLPGSPESGFSIPPTSTEVHDFIELLATCRVCINKHRLIFDPSRLRAAAHQSASRQSSSEYTGTYFSPSKSPQRHSAVGSFAECLGRSSRPLLNAAAPLPLSSLLLRGYDELNALFLNGSILSHCS